MTSAIERTMKKKHFWLITLGLIVSAGLLGLLGCFCITGLYCLFSIIVADVLGAIVIMIIQWLMAKKGVYRLVAFLIPITLIVGCIFLLIWLVPQL